MRQNKHQLEPLDASLCEWSYTRKLITLNFWRFLPIKLKFIHKFTLFSCLSADRNEENPDKWQCYLNHGIILVPQTCVSTSPFRSFFVELTWGVRNWLKTKFIDSFLIFVTNNFQKKFKSFNGIIPFTKIDFFCAWCSWILSIMDTHFNVMCYTYSIH